MKKPDDKKSTPLTGSPRKRVYQKPVLTNLGSVAKITQSSTGSVADFMGQMVKMQ